MAQQLEKTSDATALIAAMVTRARAAQSVIGKSDFTTRCAVLQAAATLIRAQKTSILEVNKKDVAAAKASGISGAFIDRLTLDDSGVEAMANGLEAMTRLHDPIGHELARWQQPSGLDITRISTPLGVIGIIYESRPNVTVDAAGLCIIAGNAAILRGGSDSQLTASLLASIMAEGLDMVGLPRDAVQMVPTTDRQAVGAMLGAVGGIDVVIPRGGRSLVERVQTEARVPVFAHLEGVCHVYVHCDADPEKARRIMLNAKMRRTGICGAAETLLIDKAVAATLLADITVDLLAAGCALRGDAAACALVPAMTPATETDFYTEYLDAILSVAVVDDIDGAIAHIGKYGSAHTDAIITQSAAAMIVVGLDKMRIDDPVGAIPVHGIAGIWGTLAVGLFGTAARTVDSDLGASAGLFYGGGGEQLWVQFYGVMATIGFTGAATLILWLIIKYTVGLRVSEEQELAGLDISEHGMYGYPEQFIEVPGAFPESTRHSAGMAMLSRPTSNSEPE